MQRFIPKLLAIGLLTAASARAGSAFYDFNSDQPDPTTVLNFGGTLWDGISHTGTGSANWQTNGGAGPVGSTTNGPVKPGVNGDGFLQLTFASLNCGTNRTLSSGLSGCVLFNDFDAGLVIAGFTLEADLRIGNGQNDPADGFSINYCRSYDPVLTALAAGDTFPAMNGKISLNGGQFEDNGGGGDLSLMEEGTSTGLAIGFDMWDSGDYTVPPTGNAIGLEANGLTHDNVGLDIRVDGVMQASVEMPNGTTRPGSDPYGNAVTAGDPNGNNGATDPTSLETGPFDNTGCDTTLAWVHMKVDLSTNGVVNVFWKNKQIITNLQTSFFPSPGRLLLASRVGGNTANIEIDNIQLTTIPAIEALVGPAVGFVDGFEVQLGDSGQSVVDTNQPILLTLNGKSVTPTSVTKVTGTTTVIYHAGFPNILPSGSTNSWTLVAKDTAGNPIQSGNRTFVAPSYATIPGSDAIATGVDTTRPGFRLGVWWSDGQPNRVYWSDEQLLGYHGPNQADLTGFNDNGYLDYTSVLNFFTNPTNGAAGDFGTNNGYPDVQFPGLAGTGSRGWVNNPSASMEAYPAFLKFNAPGLYEMGVNSDDGFQVTEGPPNPKDRFAKVLGQFDGGRGPSDTRFSFVITNAGIYPFRLLYENGAGGTGALEWFLVHNGVRVLINDPDPTNTTGVTAYFSGPQLPAYVSHIKPYSGQGSAWPDQVLAQITDGSTTVNQGSIGLTVSGSGVTSPTPTISKSGGVTTVTLSFSPLLLSSSNYTATLVWSDNATPPNVHSNAWSFKTVSYGNVLDASLSAPLSGITTNPPGFILTGAQMDNSLPGNGGGVVNQNDAFNALNGGLYFPWYGSNVIDAATATAVNDSAFIQWSNYICKWVWTNPAIMELGGYAGGGDFPADWQMPGIYSSANYQDVAAWLDSYVVFPTAGLYQMGVNSDDGFRMSEGYGLKRQVLHVTGTNGINTDVAAVVSVTTFGNGGFGAVLPQTPISGQVVYVNSNNYTGGSINLTGKIALVDQGFYGAGDFQLCSVAQTNGAIGFIEINSPANGSGSGMGGGPTPSPITIPALNVNGAFGQRDWWLTNGTLTASIGASSIRILGSADYGRGDSHTDFAFVVPQAGAYPIHLSYFGGNGGGNNFEWSVIGENISADGARVRMNDVTNSLSLVAYQTATVVNIPKPLLSISRSGTSVSITFTGTLLSSPTANGTYTPVAGANSPYPVPLSGSATFYRSSSP